MSERKGPSKGQSRGAALGAALFIFVAATLIVTLCSKSSPLYPLNDWVDSNCFFTVGKSVLSGVVPYRDLIEQKGPVLYFIHTLAALVSYHTFFGVYLIEIVTAFVFLWYSFKTVRLLTDGRYVLVTLPILAAFVFTSSAFAHGDSVEEFTLAPWAYAIYVGFKTLKTKRPPSAWEAVLIGITSGLVFWSKYTLVGLYVGWFVLVAWTTVEAEGLGALGRLIAQILGGVLIVTLPVLFYFALHGALDDLFQVYFVSNLAVYSRGQEHGKLLNIVNGFKNSFQFLRAAGFATAMGLVLMAFLEPVKDVLHWVLQYGMAVAFIFVGGRSYVYYPLALGAFIAMPAIAVERLMAVRVRKHRRAGGLNPLASLASLLLCLSLCWQFSGNAYLRFEEPQNMPQFQFAEIINKKPNATLLNMGFLDGGFYTTTGIVPSERAFVLLNLPDDRIWNMQVEAALAGRPDFIVTRNSEPELPRYDIVARASYFFEADQNYTLYQKKEDEGAKR
ncbi:MAG: glycosyltransferase family 39 protein [Peptoniphilaceae bacterium]|nr:glycosyltransferase family 39 protein [Peptoniphilaceae bacterium]MDY6086181.1 glycosyltransferase family 39 protein [Peptoniphilaceae bacterium]